MLQGKQPRGLGAGGIFMESTLARNKSRMARGIDAAWLPAWRRGPVINGCLALYFRLRSQHDIVMIKANMYQNQLNPRPALRFASRSHHAGN